jgi:hypothetical protein
MYSGNLNRLEPSGLVQAFIGFSYFGMAEFTVTKNYT